MVARRPIPSQPGYEADEEGGIWSTKRGLHLLAVRTSSGGYLRFNSYATVGRSREVFVHKAVAEAFHGPRPAGLDVRHLNGDKLDNRADNLCYGTRAENIQDAVRHGTHYSTRKTECPQGHQYTAESIYIYKGSRKCKLCQRETTRRYKQRQKEAITW